MKDGRGEGEARGDVLNERPPHSISVDFSPSASRHFPLERRDKSLSKQMGLCENTALICNLRPWQKHKRGLGCRSHRRHKPSLSSLFPLLDWDPGPLHLIRNGRQTSPYVSAPALSEMDATAWALHKGSVIDAIAQ